MGEIFAKERPSEAMAFTGERMTSAMSGQIEYEHLHRYLFARELCRGHDVLDVASGEGYGAALLAQSAHSVVGVELDLASVEHARATYRHERLRFLQGDARRIPVPDECVDRVVSFERSSTSSSMRSSLTRCAGCSGRGDSSSSARPTGMCIRR